MAHCQPDAKLIIQIDSVRTYRFSMFLSD